MKYCPYCGKEYPDDVDLCPADRQKLQQVGQPADTKVSATSIAASRDEISPEEKRFWERMTFRQLAILIVRIQAVWMIFNGIVEASYLSRYIGYLSRVSVFDRTSGMSSYEKRELCMLILRILFHFGAAIFLIQKAEKILSWLVKDYVEESAKK